MDPKCKPLKRSKMVIMVILHDIVMIKEVHCARNLKYNAPDTLNIYKLLFSESVSLCKKFRR